MPFIHLIIETNIKDIEEVRKLADIEGLQSKFGAENLDFYITRDKMLKEEDY